MAAAAKKRRAGDTEAGRGREEGKQTAAAGPGQVLYEDDAIKPENRDVVEQIRKSGVLERPADWTNEAVALPHDMEVRVTDDVPEGVTDQVTQPDGRTIFIPASSLTDTHEIHRRLSRISTANRLVPPPCSPGEVQRRRPQRAGDPVHLRPRDGPRPVASALPR